MTNLTLANASSIAANSASTGATTEKNVSLDLKIRTSSYRQTYHEIADQHVLELDVVEQLRANMAQLEDLHGRLRFAMSEITYLMKKV